MDNGAEPSLRMRAMTSPRKSTRIVILGAKHVGKSTIAQWFVNKWFAAEFVSETSDQHLLMSDTMTVDLIDNDNLSTFDPAMKMNMRRADGFVLVYAVNDVESFEYIRDMRDEINNMRGNSVPIIVVGNKTDCQPRNVNPVLADCLVTIDWEHTHIEASALNENDLQVVFDILFLNPSIKQKTGYCIWRIMSQRHQKLQGTVGSGKKGTSFGRRKTQSGGLMKKLKRKISNEKTSSKPNDAHCLLCRRSSHPACVALSINNDSLQDDRRRAASVGNMFKRMREKMSVKSNRSSKL